MTLREAAAELRRVTDVVESSVWGAEASHARLLVDREDLAQQLAEATADVARLLGELEERDTELAESKALAADLSDRLAKSNEYARRLKSSLPVGEASGG